VKRSYASVLLRRTLPKRAVGPVLALLSQGERSLMGRFGFGASLKSQRPVAEDGSPLPWLPYVVTEILKARLKPDMAVFEFGGGYSTRFFMTRVGTVTTVEHDASWCRKLQEQVDPNVSVLFRDAVNLRAYASAITEADRSFDLVLVDGIARVESFSAALPALSSRGVILLDDSDRANYEACFVMARKSGFKALSLVGHKPGAISMHQSTLFYRAANCLDI